MDEYWHIILGQDEKEREDKTAKFLRKLYKKCKKKGFQFLLWGRP